MSASFLFRRSRLVAVCGLMLVAVSILGCVPTVAGIVIAVLDSIGGKAADGAPSVSIGAIARTTGPVEIPVTVVDAKSRTVNLAVTYDVGNGFQPASASGATISASAEGAATTIMWDAPADLSGTAFVAGIRVRITPTVGSTTGAAVTSQPFDFGNSKPMLANLTINNGAASVRGNAVIQLTMADAESDAVSIATLDFSGDGFQTATPIGFASANEVPVGTVANIATTAGGIAHSFVWDSMVTVPNQDLDAIAVRLKVTDAFGAESDFVVTSPFDLNNGPLPVPPTATIDSLTPSDAVNGRLPGAVGQYIDVAFTLADGNANDVVDVAIEFSTDNGGTWHACTAHANSPSGKTGLAAGAGTQHHYFWEPFIDATTSGLPEELARTTVDSDGDGNADLDLVAWTANVRLRVVPMNPGVAPLTGPAAETLLDLGNSQPAIAVDPIFDEQGRQIAVTFTLFDAASDALDIVAEYQLATDPPGTWHPASTILFAPASTTNLPSAPAGVFQAVVWNSAPDIANSAYRDTLIIRVAARDGAVGTVGALRSTWADTGTFFDRQNTLPTAQLSPNPSVHGGNVTFDFSLADSEADVCQTIAEFAASSDGGNTWSPWTPATIAGSMAGLSSSTAGISYVRTWTSVADLPGFDGLARLRLRAIDFENGPWHVLPDLGGNPQNIVLMNSAVVNSPPTLDVSGTGIIETGPGAWKAVIAPGEPLPGIISIFGIDADTADVVTLTCSFDPAASVGFAGVSNEITAAPGFDGFGTSTANVIAPNPATVLLFPAGIFPAAAMAVFNLVVSDNVGGQVTGTLRIHINVAPQIAVPTAPGSPIIAGANRYETALVAGNPLAFSLTASDGNANDTIAFSATVTGGSLSATAAGFNPGTFPASTNSASPAALNFSGTAGGTIGDIEITFIASDDHGAIATLVFTIMLDVDSPDDGFVDLDGDGIDGSVATAIFVDGVAGNDANPGTPTSPKRTIQAGIDAAVLNPPKTDVYVSEGSYTGNLVLADGINIYGGYSRNKTNTGGASANAWGRSNSYGVSIVGVGVSVPAIGGCAAIRAENLTTPTRLDRLTITGDNAIAAGDNAYGIFARDAGSQLTIHRCTIIAGNGAAGNAGADGLDGSPGSSGTASQFKASSAGGVGANGAFDGGNGGRYTSGQPALGNGQPGGGPLAGSGGAALFVPMSPTQHAFAGDGTDGGNGIAGNSGLGAAGNGNIVNGIWRGITGTHGSFGSGGSGGGGGGMVMKSWPSPDTWYSGCSGGGGGGGGAGGEGGLGGGGSFAIYLVNSTPTLSSTTLQSQTGGAGGAGAPGGTGGNGGAGSTNTQSIIVSGFLHVSGKGGNGGMGGAGGAGGGGLGGASFALFRGDSSSDIADAGNNTLIVGTPGNGGISPAGGASNGATGPTGPRNW